MPYIQTRTTVEITPEKEAILKEKLGKAIEAIPGKSEAWLMLAFEDKIDMYFKGDCSQDYAYLDFHLCNTQCTHPLL